MKTFITFAFILVLIVSLSTKESVGDVQVYKNHKDLLEKILSSNITQDSFHYVKNFKLKNISFIAEDMPFDCVSELNVNTRKTFISLNWRDKKNEAIVSLTSLNPKKLPEACLKTIITHLSQIEDKENGSVVTHNLSTLNNGGAFQIVWTMSNETYESFFSSYINKLPSVGKSTLKSRSMALSATLLAIIFLILFLINNFYINRRKNYE